MSTAGAARHPDLVMSREVLGAAWPTKFSFSETFLRSAATRLRHLDVAEWSIGPDGAGHVLFEVEFGGERLWTVFYSQLLDPSQHQDRIIATQWDFMGALLDHRPSPEEIAAQGRQLPQVIAGRALPGTLAWSRGNRSARLFTHVVDRLAAGEQPDPVMVDEVGYLIRTTSFAANGRAGMREYAAIRAARGPLGPSFHAQMLMAYVWREFGARLAEHLAQLRSADAVTLDPSIRRRVGIGNSSGIGLVPFLVRHPRLVQRWVVARETALVTARARSLDDDARVGTMLTALVEAAERTARYLREWRRPEDGPFESPFALADEMDRWREALVDATAGPGVGDAVDWADAHLSTEARELVIALVHEADPREVDPWIMSGDESLTMPAGMSVDELRGALVEVMAWATELESSQRYFWYTSEENFEPRRGVRGEDPGEEFELRIDPVSDFRGLHAALATHDGAEPAALALLRHPEFQESAGRAAVMAREPYGQIHVDLMAEKFAPIELMRFQLAMYGMNKFSPVSDSQLRVTLFQGAPLPQEIAEHGHEGSLFRPRRSAQEARHQDAVGAEGRT